MVFIVKSFHQISRLDWQTTLHRDDVVAEWKEIKEEMSLHVHCYVSGSDILQDLVAGFRYHSFSKELPVVLKAVVHLYMEILSYLGSTLSCWKLRYGCTSIQD